MNDIKTPAPMPRVAPSAAPSADTALDARQRQMLAAMGIQVWQPAPQALETTATPAPPHARLDSKSHTANHASNQPIAQANTAKYAIENVAISTPATLARPDGELAHGAKPSIALPSHIAHMNWQQLQSAVTDCRACGLCQTRRQALLGAPIFSPNAPQTHTETPADQAPIPRADWLIVGDAPNEENDAAGDALSGMAGKLLSNMLAAVSISLQTQRAERPQAALQETQDLQVSQKNNTAALPQPLTAYVTHALKCRAPQERQPSPEESAACQPYLARQIELLRPTVILAMGKVAITALTGHNQPAGKLRGRVHALHLASAPESPSGRVAAPVIVTYESAQVLRNPASKAQVWEDLMLAMQTAQKPPL